MLRSSDPREFLNVFQQGNPVFEIRIVRVPGEKGIFAGHFGSVDEAIKAIGKFEKDKKPEAFYCSLNTFETGKRKRLSKKTKLPFDVEIKADGVISSKGEGGCISDEDITARRWLFIDVDPIRPKGINSSDVQNNAAIAMAEKVRDDMVADGWPMPIFGMSGNGACLLWRVDFKESDYPDLIYNCVYAMIERYTPDGSKIKSSMKESMANGTYSDADNAASTAVDVDNQVHNGSRICKIFGTMTRKGDHSELRPQRQSWFEYPESIDVVSVDKLQVLAGTRTISVRKKTASVSALIETSGQVAPCETLPSDDPFVKETIEDSLKKWAMVPESQKRTWVDSYGDWLKVGIWFHSIHDSMLPHWIEFSKMSVDFDPRECEYRWGTFTRREGGISPDWINHYIPKHNEAHEYAWNKLRMMADLGPGATSDLLETMKLWNSQRSHKALESVLAHEMTQALEFEVNRRNTPGNFIGDASPNTLDEAMKQTGVNSLVFNKSKESRSVATVEEKETLTAEDTAKVLKACNNSAKLLTCKPLSMDQLMAIEGWVLKKRNGIPIRYKLLIPSEVGFCETELSPTELLSVTKAEAHVHQLHNFFFPMVLQKVWKSVVDHLCKNLVVIENDFEQDGLATALASVKEICLSSAKCLTQVSRRTNNINMNHMNTSELAFRQSDENGKTIAYWFNARPMCDAVLDRQTSLRQEGFSSANFFTALAKAGVQLRKNTPSGIREIKQKMAFIDQSCFDRICELCGDDDNDMTPLIERKERKGSSNDSDHKHANGDADFDTEYMDRTLVRKPMSSAI